MNGVAAAGAVGDCAAAAHLPPPSHPLERQGDALRRRISQFASTSAGRLAGTGDRAGQPPAPVDASRSRSHSPVFRVGSGVVARPPPPPCTGPDERVACRGDAAQSGSGAGPHRASPAVVPGAVAARGVRGGASGGSALASADPAKPAAGADDTAVSIARSSRGLGLLRQAAAATVKVLFLVAAAARVLDSFGVSLVCRSTPW